MRPARRARRQKPGEAVTAVTLPSGVVREFHVPEEGMIGEDPERQPVLAAADQPRDPRPLLSLVLCIIGTLTGAVGVALVWGIGAALAISGGVVLLIGLLLGNE